MTVQTERTDYGFKVGDLDVSLAYSDDKLGATVLLRTGRQEVQVHVSPKGRSLRVFGPHGYGKDGKGRDDRGR
jgi:hypothetical protein